ncbi:MAG TPA: ABC transporter substrate-binding protein [Stellaceae bacterium]|nr:ABC transporter substrate-binding protein [Stellaceae bacterium]
MKTRLALVMAAMILAGAAEGGERLVIRIAWATVPAELTPVLFEKKDMLDHLGSSYTVEHLHFGPSATVLQALAAGEIDIAALSPATFALAIRNAGLEDLRAVADDYQDGVAKRYSSEFMVRDAGPIRAVEDLRGRVVAVEAQGSMADLGLKTMLRRHGLEDVGFYREVEPPLANMGAMLEAGNIDLAALPAPFTYVLKARGSVRTLFTLRDALGPSQGLMLVARAGFLDAHRAALADFFEDYLRALRWFLDPAHRDEAVMIVASFTRAPRAMFDDYLFTADDYYRDPDARPNLAAVQKAMDALRAEGIIDIAIDARPYADPSFVEEAGRRLKQAR